MFTCYNCCLHLGTHLAPIYKTLSRKPHDRTTLFTVSLYHKRRPLSKKKEQVLSSIDRQEFHDFLDQLHHESSFLLADE